MMTSFLSRITHAFKFLCGPHKYRRALATTIDYLHLRWNYAYLRSIPKNTDGKRVLLLGMNDWVPRAKLEAMILAMLQIKGARPVVLTERNCFWAKLYYRAFGIHDFVYFNDYVQQARTAVDDQHVEEILHQHPEFHQLLLYEHEGLRTGKLVLSSVVRLLLDGSVNFDDPEAQAQLRTSLKNSLIYTKAAQALFSDHQFDVLLTREKGYTPYGELFEVAQQYGTDTIIHHHGHRNDALVLKRFTNDNLNQHQFAFSQESWKNIITEPWSTEEEELFMQQLRDSYESGTWFNRKFLLSNKKLKSPNEVRNQLGLDTSKKTAVIFSHVLWDATFFYGTNLFKDYEEWLIQTVKVACNNTAVNWIIKLHPDYVWKLKQVGKDEVRDIVALSTRIDHLPEHIQIVPPDTDINTYSFFAITDYCLTVRGTIGIEAPCFGIPVLTAGTGRYSGLGFTNDSQTPEEYLEKLRTIQDIPPLSPEETSLGRRHAQALFERRILPTPSFEVTPSNVQHVGIGLDMNLTIHTKTQLELAQAEDTAQIANWVLHSSQEDYIHPRS